MSTTHHTQLRRLKPGSPGTGAVRSIARLSLMVLPLVHLILSPVHVGALLKLENQVSGFLMFLSILFGLVVLFQATRMKAGEPLGDVLCILGVVVVIGFTFALLSIYHGALRFQKPLDSPEVVRKAVALCIIVCSVYALCALVLMADLLAAVKRNLKRKVVSHG